MEECTYRWGLQQSVLSDVLENIYVSYAIKDMQMGKLVLAVSGHTILDGYIFY